MEAKKQQSAGSSGSLPPGNPTREIKGNSLGSPSFFIISCLFFFLMFSGLRTWLFNTVTPTYNATLLAHLYAGVLCLIMFTYYTIRHLRWKASVRNKNLPLWALLDLVAVFILLDPPVNLASIARPILYLFLAHFFYCAIRHTYNQIREENKVVNIVGFLGAFFFLGSAFIGLINLFGNITNPYLFLNGHRISSFVFILFWVLHLYYHSRDTRVATREWNAFMVRRLAVSAVVGLLLLALVYPCRYMFVTPEKIMREYEMSNTPAPQRFWKSNMKLTTRHLPAPELIAKSKSCGDHAGCHSDIMMQWESSSHRLAGNRLVRTLIQRAIEEKGMEEGALCITCHIPASALTGQITSDFYNQKDSTIFEGSSCVVCHSISKISPIGNVSFTVDPPLGWIQAGPLPSQTRKLFLSNILLILSKPDYHNRIFRRKNPIYSSSEYCATCHEVYNDTPSGRKHPQDTYQSWVEWKWKTGKEDSCQDCHMPAFKDHVGNMIKSHRFPGANQALTILTSDWVEFIKPTEIKKLIGVVSNNFYPEAGTEALDRENEAYLKGEMELKKVWYDYMGRRRERVVLEKGPILGVEINISGSPARGEIVEVVVVTKNLKVGHTFPTGDLQILETWLDFMVMDARGVEIYRNGYLDSDNFLDPEAHKLGNLNADIDGKPILDGRVWRAKSNIYYRVIPPDGDYEDKYVFTIPAQAQGPLAFKATWRYRRANQHVVNTVFGATSGVTLPVTDLVSATKTFQLQ